MPLHLPIYGQFIGYKTDHDDSNHRKVCSELTNKIKIRQTIKHISEASTILSILIFIGVLSDNYGNLIIGLIAT
jgi:hypothetical protein